MSAPQSADPRSLRRRHLHQRQTVILGTLLLAMAGIFLVAWLMWIEVLPSPFARDFSSPPPEESVNAVACPPEGAVTVPYSEISAAVYNSTNTAGLASGVAASLTGVGVTVNGTANWDELYVGVGFLRSGVNGLEEAYTLQLAFPGMIVTKDAREDALVDVVLGSEYAGMADPTTVMVGVPVTIPPECLPAAPTEAPAGTVPAEGTAPAESPAAEG